MDPVSATAVAGLALTAGSKVASGIGQSNADNYHAAELERQAEFGRVKATQTGAQLSQRLDMQLGNIDAVRAAMHDDPRSPTGAAIRDWQETVDTTQKTTAVDNIMEQVTEDESAAAYERSAAKYALFGGVAGAGGSLLTSASKTDFSNFGGS